MIFLNQFFQRIYADKVIEKPKFNVDFVEHTQLTRWKINYEPEKTENEKTLKLYPQLNLNLDSLKEGHILSLDSGLQFFLQLGDRKNEHNSVNGREKNEFIYLVSEYFNNNGNKSLISPIIGGYEGWNFAPFSSAKDICSTIDSISSQLSVNDLSILASLKNIRDYQKRPSYNKSEEFTNKFIENAMKGEYYNKQQNLIDKVKNIES